MEHRMTLEGRGTLALRKWLIMAMVLLLATFAALRDARAVTITPDTGWTTGVINTTADILDFDFTLASDGIFSLTDCCMPGDVWTITGSFAGASTFVLSPLAIPLGLGGIASIYDPYWLSTDFSHFQIALTAGSYAIQVTGDGAGGLLAEVGMRVDTAAVPLPAAGLLLMGALAGLGALRRRATSRTA